ncbi:MAG: hypothetical protein V3V84_10285 [Candidatus Bathyarchaeia archaeon]|jgi:hypothetical protein
MQRKLRKPQNLQVLPKKIGSDCYDKHMSWELQHKGLAERVSGLLKKNLVQDMVVDD